MGTACDAPRRVASFEEVYRAERDELLRLAYLLVRSRAVAEELAQDAFARLYECWPEVENAPGWLRTTLVRLCLTWLTRRAMEAADCLYGVTMQPGGSSKVVSERADGLART